MFLDTHPNDKATMEKIKKYKELLEPLKKEYTEKFGPLVKQNETNNWSWIKGPWPWEEEENE